MTERKSMPTIFLDGQTLEFSQALRVIFDGAPVALSAASRARIAAAHDLIKKRLADGRPIYGINTGFGKLADVRIADESLAQLQRNLVLSHACGMGQPIPIPAGRAVLLAKANTLAKGYSGVRVKTVEMLLELLNRNIIPVIPEKGSVGASGDLAPLAHLALALIGHGEVHYNGSLVPAKEALRSCGLSALKLQAKEGLALLNGTHFMTGLGLLNTHFAERLLVSADIVGAMSAEAMLCTPTAFDARIQAARGFRGQMTCAERLRKMMSNSPIRDSHLECGRVQDPYSVRCMPQVHGAILDNIMHVHRIIETELNAATDNPLIFVEEGEILSGGNFHGHPIATAMDLLAMCVSQLANISERRIAMMMDSNVSELPPFLVTKSGLNSGFMIAQVAAASLVSENKVLSHPASVDSIPTSANKEDYVSMGAQAAVKAGKVVENAARVLGIELLCACQALEFRQPLQPGPAAGAVLAAFRRRIPTMKEDRVLAGEISSASSFLLEGKAIEAVQALLK